MEVPLGCEMPEGDYVCLLLKNLYGLKQVATLTKEDDVLAYLGVQVNMDEETDAISLTQPYLIQRIINAMGPAIKNANVKTTPVVYQEILQKDKNGPDWKQTWNYRSLIEMLNYLAAST